MKNISCFFIGILLSSHCFAGESITIRADEWFPMNGEPGAEKPGFMIELAQKIFSDNGIKVDYRLMPWERALNSVRKGEHDCVVGAYPEDAPDFIYPKENWGMDSTGVFVAASDSWRFSELDSLLKRKVGVVSGYAYGDGLDELIKGRKDVFKGLSGNKALETNVKKLLSGRINTIIESPAVMNAKLDALGKKGALVLAGIHGEASELYIACSPNKENSKNLVRMVDEGTQQLRASGELKSIMSKYGLSDWK